MIDFDHVRAVLFDKDGTLFDFSSSWSGATHRLLDRLSGGNPARKRVLAVVVGYDIDCASFDPASPLIAGTLEDALALLTPHLPDLTRSQLAALLEESASNAEMVPPLPLAPLLDQISATGRVLGVATNDSEAAALLHLQRAGIRERFAHVLGYDSGYRPKPAPDMLLGFAERASIAPEHVVMVGDSTHDLIAGRAAGMPTIGVLTGLARAETLAPFADLVLPDIGHLRGFLMPD